MKKLRIERAWVAGADACSYCGCPFDPVDETYIGDDDNYSYCSRGCHESHNDRLMNQVVLPLYIDQIHDNPHGEETDQ